ncbi:MAG: Bax inhibitor-1/YccA family protein [Bacteroidetes bacterium]|nr:Bax inhibitor-1/YccA family protein [Bacteroidota bacterium]
MAYEIKAESFKQDITKVQQAFLTRVYGWMFAGLFITALFSMITLSSDVMKELIFSTPATIWVLLFAEIGLVLYLTARIEKMKSETAMLLFLVYSTLNGITLSPIFLIYTGESIAKTFIICSGMFGAMSLYGYFTKKDLTGVGSFLTMGLFGIVIASIINMFLSNDTLNWTITLLGIVIFTGLTAYNTQKMKSLSYVMMEEGIVAQKGAIIGALILYLNFINLFLMLLRLLGDRRR